VQAVSSLIESDIPIAASICSTTLLACVSEKQALKTTKRIVSDAVDMAIVIAPYPRTRIGRTYAQMMGINTKQIYLITYVISAVLAGIAGILLCPLYSVNPWMGATVQTKGMVVCILGGLGNVEGAILAGILMGILESGAVSVIGSEWRDAIAYLFLILVLYVRPAGLFSRQKEG
jgi:hypothetical protein